MNYRSAIITLASAALAQTAATAQDLTPFFPSVPGTVLEYTQTDSEGNPLMSLRDSLAEFSGNFNDGRAVIIQSGRYLTDTIVVKGREPFRFIDAEVIADMGSLMEESLSDMMKQAITMAGGEESDLAEVDEITSDVTVSGECRGIPAELTVGMKLPDYKMTVRIMFMKMTVNCKNRKVVGREELSTPAGTFDCFIVEETTSVRTMMTNTKATSRTWYARGLGMVRRELMEGKKLASTTQLTAIH